jgi:hypothetical protein
MGCTDWGGKWKMAMGLSDLTVSIGPKVDTE